MPKGQEKTLFVNDNEVFASLGEKMLSEMGYQVAVMTESTDSVGDLDHLSGRLFLHQTGINHPVCFQRSSPSAG
jgi:CheY-like chemotaxis protein